MRVLCVNPGPVSTEFQQVADFPADWVPPVSGRIPAAQVARESLAAFERGQRSIMPGTVIRWFMRVGAPSPVALKLRVAERMYRPAR